MLHFIVDIDGTICDSTSRMMAMCDELGVDREADLDIAWTQEQMKWFLSEDNLLTDGVVPGSEKLFELASRMDAKVVFLTGRSDYCREGTRKWLVKNFGERTESLKLLMRSSKWFGKPAADAKEGIFLEWRSVPWRHNEYFFGRTSPNSFIFFEDQEETIKRYTKYGLVLRSPECWKFTL